MCEIIYHEKGAEMPKVEVLGLAWDYNPDGAGLMYDSGDGKVKFIKGLLTFDSFYSTYKQLVKSKEIGKDVNFAIHFRFGTSGFDDVTCTHPFIVSKNENDMELTSGKSNLMLMHNGIVGRYNSVRSVFSDTQIFIMKELAGKDYEATLEKESYSGGSRFLLFDNGKWKMFGMWNKQKGTGLYFSNPKEKTELVKFLKRNDDEDSKNGFLRYI